MNCLHCGSSKTIKSGFRTLSNGEKVRQYRCLQCQKKFSFKYQRLPAQPANVECPTCGSSNTIKKAKPIKRKYAIVLPCQCKNCGRYFKHGSSKRLQLYSKGKLIYSFWDYTGLQHVPNVACPNCNQKKAVLKGEHRRSEEQQKVRNLLICVECGQRFSGEGRPWRNNTRRMLDKEVPLRPWQFEDDKWDLRELYPNTKEHDLNSIFLCFRNCGSNWFKKLVKTYTLWRVQSGIKFSTIKGNISCLRVFGQFLNKHQLTRLEELNRLLISLYQQERSHLTEDHIGHEMSIINNFLSWGNTEKHFSTPSTLITSFDRPKSFKNDPEPLVDSVLKAIRDNLHVLPEPLQLQFIIGFWLGTRPGELSQIYQDCCSLDFDGSIWWLEFKRDKPEDEHKLPLTTDLVRLIQYQQAYISKLFDEDYPYLFCHYQGLDERGYPNYPRMKPIKRPPIAVATENPMVKAIRHLIKQCDIRDSNGNLAHFTGAILRPSRATHLIHNGFSLEFVRIWLKHRKTSTTKRHYIRYRPGELLDVAHVMTNLDGKFYPYDSNPEFLHQNLSDLRQNPELHQLDGLNMLNGEPLYGYCVFREFCPRFGHCYTCGFHIASADKLPQYKAQLERLLVKKSEVFNYGSSEMLESYTQIVNALEDKIEALENPRA